MASFVALNIEPEDQSEDEVDDSKEIQIEEALKLYQNAMKLQSQGPGFFEETNLAYAKLFASEIFTYPESQPDSLHADSYRETQNNEIFEDSLLEASNLPTLGAEGASSTLQQLLYLSHKNHGQFLLDQLKYSLPRLENQVIYRDSPECKQILTQLLNGLGYFVRALERDDTDSELWRLVARICHYIGSKRIARYCFETVLDSDRKTVISWPAPLRLDQSFATIQLMIVLQEIPDDPSKSQLITTAKEQMTVAENLEGFIDSCPFLPPIQQELHYKSNEQEQPRSLMEPQEIHLASRTWANCGQSLIMQFDREAQDPKRTPLGAKYFLTLPPKPVEHVEETNSNLQRKAMSSLVGNPSEQGQLLLENTEEKGSQGQSTNQSEEIWATPATSVSIVKNEEIQEDELPSQPPTHEDNNPSEFVLNKLRESDEYGLENPSAADERDNSQQISTETGMKSGEAVSLPSRKRSSDSAGMQDNNDTGRSRSKRIKARGSITESNSVKEILAEEKQKFNSDQLRACRQVDNCLFEAVGDCLSKFNVNNPGAQKSQSEFVLSPHGLDDKNSGSYSPSEILAQDLTHHLAHWDAERCDALLAADNLELNPHSSTLTLFLEHSKREHKIVNELTSFAMNDQLDAFTRDTRLNLMYLDQLALRWVEALLSPKQRNEKNCDTIRSSYEQDYWPQPLKKTIEKMLVRKDEFIYTELSSRVKGWDQRLLGTVDSGLKDGLQPPEKELIEIIQSIFEIHIDIFSSMTSVTSGTDILTREFQFDCIRRWAALANDAISKFDTEEGVPKPIEIRFLWSSVLYTSLVEPAARDHIVLCFQDLKRMLEGIGNPVIELPNNTVMPEISAERADGEISRLSTMDFFLNIFSFEKNDLVSVFETLEPILERSMQRQNDSIICKACTKEKDLWNSTEPDIPQNESDAEDRAEYPFSPRMQQVILFLDHANISLKYFLWQKLGESYAAIDYPPRILSCHLRSIETIMGHLRSASYISGSASTRGCNMDLLRWIRKLGMHAAKALRLALEAPNAFECVDESHLRSSMDAVASLQRVLWAQSDWDDSLRVGLVRPLRASSTAVSSNFDRSAENLRSTLVSVWMLQYTLLKEAFEQNPQLSKSPNEDLINYLKLLHRALGLRSYCAISDKIFLRYMKSELLRLDAAEGSGNDMAQIVYDLYGLKTAPNMTDLENHNCPSATLDRETAFEIMDLVMAQVGRMNIKDLGKSELKSTIDKMQQAIKVPKATPNMLFNRRVISNYMKSPINPLDLYRSLHGIGSLSGWAVNNVTLIGDKGWYFLLGHLSLAKFRSQKRTSAGPIDDLEIAIAFLRQDLELGSEKWETWYRLAQVYDAVIEEEVGWTAEKLNSHMGDLRTHQRNSIHCYTMAVAIAMRSADPSFETVRKISDLYVDFAFRIYASSREPFSMQVFGLKDTVRHYNGEARGMYEGKPFREMQLYSAWKLVCALLRRALVHKSDNWMVHYMLGKCLWKMHNCSDEIRGRAQKINYTEVLDIFKKAIELLPERRDSRHPEKDPTLEPHYKLVSIVHKLVLSKRIQPGEGCRHLETTIYARKTFPVHDLEAWEGYLLHVLKALRSADRSNWHHRMVARAAHVIYDDAPDDLMAVLGAKHELTQQIFTKTMHTQIWRPDNERPGRHFVYTSRYVSFFVRILSQLSDRASLEILAKRIRKRPGDFFNHTAIWEEVCMAYLKLLRQHDTILNGNEDLVFKTLPHATFILNADRLETWAHSPTNASPILDLLREVVELKKLNSNLMKSGPIEDLIGDTYAHLYEMVVPELVVKSNTEENRVRMRVDHLLMNTSIATPEEPPTEPPTKSARPKSVGRREIQRKAEAIVTKPPPPPTAVSSKPGPPAGTSAKVFTAVAIPEKEPEQAKNGVLLAVREMDDTAKDVSSVPGSVHDSADDESELSEIEDAVDEVEAEGEAEGEKDEGVKVLFPNLNKGRGRGEVEDDEDDEEVEEGDGDEQDRDEGNNGMEMDVDRE